VCVCVCGKWAGGNLFSGLFVREFLCVPKTLLTQYLKNQWRELHPILVTSVLGFIDVPIRFWGQKVKGQGHSRQWPRTPCACNIFVTVWDNFTKISSHMYLGQEAYWLGLQVKRSKVKVTAAHQVPCVYMWTGCNLTAAQITEPRQAN